jgi:hypothetical protein
MGLTSRRDAGILMGRMLIQKDGDLILLAISDCWRGAGPQIATVSS